MAKRGLVIGKFYPPHLGHHYLIETAQAQVEALVVLVCEKPEQQIPGELRAAWIREVHPGVEVQIVPDILEDDDSAGWADYTRRWLGYTPDVVFTSEDYGDLYAHFLGCQHVQVDRERQHMPISGTAVRNNPLAHWGLLAPCVRAYFARRVCVLGAESTGTTTMAQARAEHYQTACIDDPAFTKASCSLSTDGLPAFIPVHVRANSYSKGSDVLLQARTSTPNQYRAIRFCSKFAPSRPLKASSAQV